jgi:hypothetical protein
MYYIYSIPIFGWGKGTECNDILQAGSQKAASFIQGDILQIYPPEGLTTRQAGSPEYASLQRNLTL